MKISKWFKRFKLHISWITAVVAAGAAIASVCVTLNTLEEMRIDRNNAYMPDIVLKQEVEPLATNALIKEHSELGVRVLENEYIDNYKFDILNIGVGVAKNIIVEFDENSVIDLAKWLQKRGYGEYLEIIGDTSDEYIFIEQKIPEENDYFETTLEHSQKIQYILPSAEEVYPIKIPGAYIGLIHRAYYLNKGGTDLKLNISWEDIQGHKYQKKYILIPYDKNLTQSEHIAYARHSLTIDELVAVNRGEEFTGYKDVVHIILQEKKKE